MYGQLGTSKVPKSMTFRTYFYSEHYRLYFDSEAVWSRKERREKGRGKAHSKGLRVELKPRLLSSEPYGTCSPAQPGSQTGTCRI